MGELSKRETLTGMAVAGILASGGWKELTAFLAADPQNSPEPLGEATRNIVAHARRFADLIILACKEESQ